jgi:hypothetical protein
MRGIAESVSRQGFVLNGQGFIHATGKIFFSLYNVHTGCDAHPVVTDVLLPGVKWPWCGDHSFPSKAEGRNEWSFTAIPRVCLRGVGRDVLTLNTRQDTLCGQNISTSDLNT